MNIHEQKLVENFVIKPKRDRYLFLLSNPKRRKDFIDKLSHFNDFIATCLTEVENHLYHSERLYEYLKAKHAENIVHIISEDRLLDNHDLDLRAALSHTLGSGNATIISCIPGKLAFFENEDGQFLLSSENI